MCGIYPCLYVILWQIKLEFFLWNVILARILYSVGQGVHVQYLDYFFMCDGVAN
jgi:hypothetical protein